MDITIGILAGGKSNRMGQNKAFLKYEGKTFLEGIIDELETLGETLIAVDDKNKYSNICKTILEDEFNNIGPIEGLRQIIKHAKTEYTFVCATDMPFLKKELVLYLCQFVYGEYDCYAVNDSKGAHPLCAIYSKNILPQIEKAIEAGNYRLQDLLRNANTKYVSLEYSCFSENIVENINRLEEYKNLKKPYIFCISGVKNSGKTTLICKLIQELKCEYKNIAVIKHDGHNFEIDREPCDTNRFRESGANIVSIFSEKKYALICQKDNVCIEEAICMALENCLLKPDIVIIEGMKNSNFPKIEVVRDGVSNEIVCDQNTIIGVATDTYIKNIGSNIKILDINNIKGIKEEIVAYLRGLQIR